MIEKKLDLLRPAVEVERRADGSLVLRSPVALASCEYNLGRFLYQWAREAPEQTFVAERSGGTQEWRHLTYRAACDQAERIGHALLGRGLHDERPVMVLSGNSVNFAALQLGALLAGIAVVPVSPAYSLMSKDHAKLRHVVERVRPGLIYVEDLSAFTPALQALDLSAVEVVAPRKTDSVIGATVFDELLREPPGRQLHEAFERIAADTIVKILFTSGSTGMPKGVITTQRMLCTNQQAIRQLWPFLQERPPVIVDWLPWSHTFGGCHNFYMMLRNGGTIYIDAGKPLPGMIEQTVANLRQCSPTLYFNVPAGYQALLAYLEEDQALRESFFRDLDLVFYAAASLPQGTRDRIERLSVATLGYKLPMLSAYGATETAPLATSTYGSSSRAGAIGLPVPGTVIKMVPYDDRYELRVQGANVFPGYWREPEKTRTAFDEEGFYRSEDAGALADPAAPVKGIVFRGRTAEEFKLSTGTWVVVGTLRVNVLEACAPLLQDAVVCGHDGDEIGLLAIPNLKGCLAFCGGLGSEATPVDAAASPSVRQALQNRLQRYNADHPASSTRIARLLLLTTPLSIDAGEITDKGYINQSGVLRQRAALVERLYSDHPDVMVLE